MVSIWAVALVAPALMIALVDWRKGLYALLVVAFLQDPARKLEPSQPVYFVILVAIVFAAVYVRAQLGSRFTLSRIAGWNTFLRTPFNLFLILLFAQALNSVVRYGNPIIAGIGILSYLAPLPAMLLGYHFAARSGLPAVKRWLASYLVAAVIVLPSILLEYSGVEWQTLGQVGEGFYMYTDTAVLTAFSGFFRASETAAWHTASAVCLLLLFSSMRKLSLKQVVLAVAMIVALLTIGALTGRRKIFVEVVIFMSCYVSLLLWFGKGGLKLASAVFIGGVLVYALVIGADINESKDLAELDAGRFHEYAGRTASVGEDIWERAIFMGLQPVEWAVTTYGFLGGGLGIGSQGAQHFGGGAEVYGGSSEGGLGKITAELGVPGLLLVLWMGYRAIRYAWEVLLYVSRRSSSVARLAYGLLAFLIANLAVFFVATQLFGDLFVLILLGLMLGFFLATPILAERAQVQTEGRHAPAVAGRPSGRGRGGIAQGVRRS
jgi:hypothetical protein